MRTRMALAVSSGQQAGCCKRRSCHLPLLLLLVLCFATVLSACSASVVSERTIRVSMAATWPSTPLLVETAEHLAAVRPEHYWAFLTLLSEQLAASPPSSAAPLTDEAEYRLCLSLASQLLGHASMEVLAASLALHTHSVRAQFYHTLLHDAAVERGMDGRQLDACAVVLQHAGHLGCHSGGELDASLDSAELVHEFDHVFPAAAATVANRTVILYGELTAMHRNALHSSLTQMVSKHAEKAKEGRVQYVFRPKFVHASNTPLQLQGWGAELAVKNMEYKVLDDSRIHGGEEEEAAVIAPSTLWSRLCISSPAVIDSLYAFRDEYLRNAEDEKILVKDNADYLLTSIGLQATQVLLHSADPLVALRELTGSFPAYASALTKIVVNSTVTRGLERKGSITPGTNLISLHGQSLSLDDLDVFSLIQLLQSHSALIDHFAALHLSPASTRQLLSAASAGGAGSSADAAEAMLAMYGGGTDPDSFLVRMDTSVASVSSLLLWLNDLTKDRRYGQWPFSIREFLTPSWGQQLKYVRQNLYTGVIVADVSTRAGLELLHNCLFFVRGNAPIRLALAMYVPETAAAAGGADDWDDELLSREEYRQFVDGAAAAGGAGGAAAGESVQSKLAKLVRYLDEAQGRDAVWDYFELLYQDGQETVTEEAALTLLYQIEPDAEDSSHLKEVLSNPAAVQYVSELSTYISSRGFDASLIPSLVVHGVVHPYAGDAREDFRSYLMEMIYMEQRKAGLRVFTNVFKDRMDFAAYWDSRSNVYDRLSPHILVPAAERTFVPALLPSRPPSDPQPKLVYLTLADPEREYQVKGATYWVVADWDSVDGLKLVQAALQHVLTAYREYQTRAAFIFNPSAPPSSSSAHTNRVASAILNALTPSKAATHLRRLAQLASYILARKPDALPAALTHFLSSSSQLAKASSALSSSPSSLNKGLGLNPAVPADYLSKLNLLPGAAAIIANGYVVRPPASSSQASLQADFRVLDDYLHQSLLAAAVKPLVESFSFPGLDSDELTSDWYSDVVLEASFVLSRHRAERDGRQRVSVVQWPPVLDASEDEVVMVHESPDSWLELKVLLDPLSKEAQQLSGILLALRASFNISIQLFLNPARDVERLPLKRFYQYAVDTQLSFDSGGALLPFSGAFFRHVQTRAVLTLTVETPEPWLVGLKVAAYDVDNLKLDQLPASTRLLHIEYQLEHLLIQGQCFDHSQKPPGPPAGLQLQLSSPSVPYAGDTVVMQNLGYFQLKANPGLWSLSFPGRHAAIYQLEQSVKDGQTASDLSTARLPVLSLTDPYRRIWVQRREGQESAQLLEVTKDRPAGIFSSFFSPSDAEPHTDAASAVTAPAQDADSATIHIFSLASGHLYERFLKIMMLSVIKHTQSPVKFWFIRNFASPQFVQFVPAMAAHYGFSAEFVTYKWPVWLRRQSEKQRVIWGYKILFLDVLWPLRIPRVIYIDADQVVRGDVRELWELDLKGAPYAYVPFCDSNEETKGFRFWDSGYWKDHLRGKPYHISALYVVDLQVFRALRAGDSLRSIYDNLSADPASLSNLDQDLPNYAQHMVPILSLPQRWLWCQTWCSMDELKDAQTIDLCNNPLTKTPKLEVAKQLLPEWTGLDAEARELEEQLLARGNITAAAAGAADAAVAERRTSTGWGGGAAGEVGTYAHDTKGHGTHAAHEEL